MRHPDMLKMVTGSKNNAIAPITIRKRFRIITPP